MAEEQKIENREELVAALKDIAELEHQFMCMYLYAALSLKKEPDESCNEAQLEATRRWASTVYAIARQEMEHLSLVNSMLAALGAPPYFARENVIMKSYGAVTDLEPEKFPVRFMPFALQTCNEYACLESPPLDTLEGEESIYKWVKKWCYKDKNNGKKISFSGQEIATGDIKKHYDRVREGFIEVSKKNKSLFVPPYKRHQVDILSQYNIYIFPVTDLTSALNAIDLIIKQGEGLSKAPDTDTHFLKFYDIAIEYKELKDEHSLFAPALLVPEDPKWEPTTNVPRPTINNELTKHIYHLFNYSYVTLLYVLTGLYGWYGREDSYPYLSAALRELAFAPTMTMLIRSLSEVLVMLPLDRDCNEVAGPIFYIPPDDEARLEIKESKEKGWQQEPKYQCYTNIEFYLHRFQAIETLLNPKNNNPERGDLEPQFGQNDDLPKKIKDDKYLDLFLMTSNCGKKHLSHLPKISSHIGNNEKVVKDRLRYIWESVYRMTANLRENYQAGVYTKFNTIP